MSYGNAAIGTRGYGGNTGRAAAALSVLDKFDRGVDAPTSLFFADTGQVWNADHGTWGTLGGKAYTSVADSGGSQGGLASADLANSQQDVSVVIASIPVAGEQFGALARLIDANNYWITGIYVSGANLKLFFAKVVAGANTYVTVSTDITGTSFPATLELKADVNVLTVYVNGVQKSTTTDAANGTGTRVGLHQYASTTQRIESISAMPLAAPVNQTFTKSLAGAIANAGALAKQPGKALAGAISSAGALTRQPRKSFLGASTPAGVVTRARIVAVAMSGAVSEAGALVRQPQRLLAGASGPSGTLSYVLQHLRFLSVSGAVGSAGALVRGATHSLAGASTPAGALARTTAPQPFSGSAGPAGVLGRMAGKALDGRGTPDGQLWRRASRALAGAVSPQGENVLRPAVSASGAVTGAGERSQAVQSRLGGSSGASGAVGRLVGKSLAGQVGATAGLARLVDLALDGAVALTGAFAEIHGLFRAEPVTIEIEVLEVGVPIEVLEVSVEPGVLDPGIDQEFAEAVELAPELH